MKHAVLGTVSVLALLVSIPAAPVQAEEKLSVEELVSEQLDSEQTLLAEVVRRGSAQGFPYRDTAALKDFYKTRQYEPLWMTRGKLNKKGKAAMNVLEESWTHGLSPAVYNVKLLRSMVDAELNEKQQAEFDVLLSDGIAAYGRDITGMRLNPRSVGEDGSSWNKGITYVQTLDFVAEEDSVELALARLQPGGQLYKAMREELIRLVKDIESKPDADPSFLRPTRTLRPGDRDPAVAALRTRLGHAAKSKDMDTLYDESLALSVAKFQRASGLKPDALVGKRTYAALNQGRQDKLIKLVANLERQRWLDPRFPDRYIVVNVPAMTLWGIENGDIKLDMPVIVGREKRETMSFIANITGIRFNPSWNVPDTIKTEDFLPALQKDPDALKKKGIELIRYTSDGVENIDSSSIDWSTMTPGSIKALGMVQNPGDANALGRIRVLMPNKYDIYLHDTNSPELFVKDFRALSSGCVRVSDPEKLANFILGPNEGWTDKKVGNYLAKAKTVEVRAQSGLPVYILYQTVWMDEHAQLVYGEDIYGKDVRLVRELQKAGQIALPVKLK